MSKTRILLLLTLALSFVYLAGQPSGPIGRAVQGITDAGPHDSQDIAPTEKPRWISRGSGQSVADAYNHAEKSAAPFQTDREDSRAHAPAETVHRDVLTATFWQLADRNREAMYAVLWDILENGDSAGVELQAFILDTLDSRFDETPGGMFSVLMRTAPTPALRKEILQLLAEASQELSVKALSRALDDPDPAVRQSAAASLDGLGVEALLDAMTEAVLDNDHSVRVTAFQTLEDMHGFAAIWNVAERVVGDPDPGIRKRALELITYGGAENALDQLTRSLLDPDPQVSELALALLAEFEEGPS